jgi:hypothetical protein
MKRPRVTLGKLDKMDIKYAQEGNVERRNEKDVRNLRCVLQEEMSGSLVGDADDVVKLQHLVIEGTDFKDCTMALMHPSLDSVAKLKNEGKESEMKDDQIDYMLEVTDNKERNAKQEER